MNREIFVLLNPKTMSLRPRISGGLSELSSEDMSYLKAHVSEIASKYIDLLTSSSPGNHDERWAYDIALDLRREVAALEALEYWKPPRKEWILDMTAMALAEVVSYEIGENVCSWCDGRGEAKVNNLIVKCDGCQGSGKKLVKQSDRAKMMGTSEDRWDEWFNRYRRILGIIDGWYSEIGLAQALMRRKDGQ